MSTILFAPGVHLMAVFNGLRPDTKIRFAAQHKCLFRYANKFIETSIILKHSIKHRNTEYNFKHEQYNKNVCSLNPHEILLYSNVSGIPITRRRDTCWILNEKCPLLDVLGHLDFKDCQMCCSPHQMLLSPRKCRSQICVPRGLHPQCKTVLPGKVIHAKQQRPVQRQERINTALKS